MPGKTRIPDYGNGRRAIVLGAREGNIGGAIAERLCRAGIIAQEDDCYTEHGYAPPVEEELEPYDFCVVTLGTTHMEPFSEVSQEDFAKVITGSLWLPLEAARRYVHARSRCQREVGLDVTEDEPIGKILFIGSYAHNHPFTHCTSYCTAKAGLDMAAKTLAWELMPEGFDVHIIHPHHVQGTPMTDAVRKGMKEGVHRMTDEQAEAYSRKDLRMPDILKPTEIADMVLWLLTAPEARWLSGTNVEMYGGVR